jgi:predicted Rdx family selenoprotein
LRDAYPGVDIVLTPSSGGRFEISVDGTPIFEKSVLGRHALPGEVLSLVRKHLGK